MLPLTSLLSQLLVALTIEADNEYENRVPYFTMDHGAGAKGSGAWLISTAMYVNFLRFVPDEGIAMHELAAKAGFDGPVHGSYNGMRRWGYVTYAPDITGSAPKAKDGDALVRLRPIGAYARTAWAQTFVDLGDRWAERGLGAVQRTLIPIVETIERPLPEYVPTMGFDHRVPPLANPTSREPNDLGLLALLCQALVAMTIDFEAASQWSLMVVQGLLRPLTDEPTRVADLTERSGIAKKAWSSAVGQLDKFGLVTVEPLATGRGKSVRLSPAGAAVLKSSGETLAGVESAWRQRCGPPLDSLRNELEKVVGDGSPSSPVFAGLEPYPDGWRAKVRPLKFLPHQPLVSHRGGYPDGS